MAEARCAENRLVLPRLKWNSCFCSALCAVNMRLDPTLYSVALPLGLALQAVLRFVDESPLPKELLLSRREYEHHAATDTPDISVGEAHKPPQSSGKVAGIRPLVLREGRCSMMHTLGIIF